MLRLPISTATTSCCSGSSWSWWSWAFLEQSPSSPWSGEQQQPLLPVAQTTAASDPCASPALPGRTAQESFLGGVKRWKRSSSCRSWDGGSCYFNPTECETGGEKKKATFERLSFLALIIWAWYCVVKNLLLEMGGNVGTHVLNNSLLRWPFQNVIA